MTWVEGWWWGRGEGMAVCARGGVTFDRTGMAGSRHKQAHRNSCRPSTHRKYEAYTARSTRPTARSSALVSFAPEIAAAGAAAGEPPAGCAD